MTGLIDTLPEERLENLGSKIDSGEVTTVLSVKEDLTEAGLSEEQFSKVDIVYLGTHRNATSEKADVVLAGLTQFEKSGTVINQQFRIQKFNRVVPGPRGCIEDLYALSTIATNFSDEKYASTVGSIWKQLAGENSQFSGLSFQSLSDQGQVLDSSAFEHLPFREGESLHFEPNREAVAAE